MKLRITLFTLTILMITSTFFAQQDMSSENRIVSERLMGKVYKSGLAKDTFIVSEDSRRFAYLDKVGSKWFAVVDGNSGKQYDKIFKESLMISPDSQHVGYVAEIGKKQVMVVDGVEGKPYDRVGWGWASAVFKHNPFGSFPVFSPDGKRVAYVAKTGKQWSVVINGEEGKPYDEIGPPIFSPDSHSLAYEARLGKQWFLVLNGKEGKPYPYDGSSFLRYPIFSPDSLRIAYEISFKPSGECAVVDDTEGEKFDGIHTESIIFSPDSQRIAYVAKDLGKLFQSEKEFVVLDGQKGKPFDQIFLPLTFSPDSRRFAYAARTGSGILHLIIDGQVTDLPKKYQRVADSMLVPSICFSQDSQHLALLGDWPGYPFLLVDGKEVTDRKEEKRIFGALFSPNGQRLAYVYGKAATWTVVVDGKEGNQYDEIIHVAYVGIGNLSGEGKFVFDSSDTLHYLAIKEGHIYLVEEKIK